MNPPAVLDARGRYERRMVGWSDDAPGECFTHTVRLEDDAGGIELRATCTLAPGYEIRAAEVRVLAGELAPAVCAAVPRLAGVRMIAGLGRRLGDVLGEHAGAALVADAVFEVARLARQVAKVPAAVTAAIAPDDAAACRQLDMSGWADLSDSCFTYSDEGGKLLASRRVVPILPPAFYSQTAGAERVFVRRKLARLVRTGERLHLFSSMHDDVHGFDVHYEIDLATDTIVAADSTTSRLPYLGLCDEPQARVRSMVGEKVDALLRKRSGALLGGTLGCAQLFDLTGDVLKLLDASGR
ncbi:MAG: DUF2889 domain-containing protein [Deltaproteobacteria bacterium]|nr:DUF2889 domain-containing protein [Deltaproteobacteria bacterium]